LNTGFLSENADFAEKVEEAGFVWVGPSSKAIRQFGLKHTAKKLAVEANVSIQLFFLHPTSPSLTSDY
jgi:acetyl/propionyl-CoA carboxylase alpha subunit